MAAKKKVSKKVTKKTPKQEKTTKKVLKRVDNKKDVKKPVRRSKYVNPRDIVEPEGYIPPKSSKFLGYCPKCTGMIIELDLVSKFITVCPSCSERTRINRLHTEVERDAQIHDHKDYHEMLESTFIEPKTLHDDVPESLRPVIEDESYD